MSGDVGIEIQDNKTVLSAMKYEIVLILLRIRNHGKTRNRLRCESTPDAMYLARQGLHNLSNSGTSNCLQLKGWAADECRR